MISSIRACNEDSIAREGGGQLGNTPESLLATVLLLHVGAELVITIHVGAGSNVILRYRT